MLALVEQGNVQQKPESKENSGSFIDIFDLKAETSQSVNLLIRLNPFRVRKLTGSM